VPGLFDRLQDELERRERSEGVSPLDVLELPEDLRAVLQLIARRGAMTAREVAADTGAELEPTQALLASLEQKGFLRVTDATGEPTYKRYLGHRRARTVPLNIWDALSDKVDE
jgi:hypothetical protein